MLLLLQKDDLDGFQTPPHNAFSPDNVGSKVVLPTRGDVPSVPKNRGDSRTLPSKGRLALGGSSSVLNTSLPPPPSSQGVGVDSPRASIISTDSGIGTSVGGEIRRPPLRKNGSCSTPNSGSGMFERGTSGSSASGSSSHHSADAEFRHRVAVSDPNPLLSLGPSLSAPPLSLIALPITTYVWYPPLSSFLPFAHCPPNNVSVLYP